MIDSSFCFLDIHFIYTVYYAGLDHGISEQAWSQTSLRLDWLQRQSGQVVIICPFSGANFHRLMLRYGGYPCGLWSLWHSLTISQAAAHAGDPRFLKNHCRRVKLGSSKGNCWNAGRCWQQCRASSSTSLAAGSVQGELNIWTPAVKIWMQNINAKF